jgi:hypothetical protein
MPKVDFIPDVYSTREAARQIIAQQRKQYDLIPANGSGREK